MAFKMRGFSAFTKMDPPEKANEIKSFIKNNMNKLSDKELMKKVNSMSDGKTEYNWDLKTGKVESHKKKDTKKNPFTKKEGYKPQTQKNKQGGRDMIPQTEMGKMDLDNLEMHREAIFNNEYSDAKDDNDTSRIRLLEGRIAKLDKLIEQKRKKK